MKLRDQLRSIACLLLLLVCLSATLLAQKPAAPKSSIPDSLGQLSGSLESLVERISPSVVQIFTVGFAISQPSESQLLRNQGSGSGVILSADGYLMTNAHVVEGAQRIRVRLPSGVLGAPTGRSILKPQGKIFDAALVGTDSETDLAVLKIEAQGLPALEFGNSEEVRQGQMVVALGSPLGLENTVTLGIVSAVARQLRQDSTVIYIQTDAPINPGNSGGPLVNARSQVIGINTLNLSQSGGSEGIGLAMPSNIAQTVFQQLRDHGAVRRGIIGARVQTITPQLTAALGLSRTGGVIVEDVLPNSPAAQYGLAIGDIILTLDGKPMENARQFEVNVYRRSLGQLLTLEVLRGEETFPMRVPVVERAEGRAWMDALSGQKNLVRQVGIYCVELTPALLSRLPPQRKTGGVLVVGRAPGISQSAGRFESGDIIYAINRAPVNSLSDLRGALDGIKEGAPVVVQIERLGQLMFIVLEVD